MAGINTATQYVGHLVGGLKFEIGYRTDVTTATGLTAAELSETHCIPTTLEHVLAGWLYTKGTGTAAALPGSITGPGSPTEVTGQVADSTAEFTGVQVVCFTLDGSSDGGTSGDYYLIFGW